MRNVLLPTAGEAAGAPQRRRRNGERGQSLIELALTLPILLVLLMGLIEFGHAYNSYLTLVASGRDAARMAAQGGATGTTLRTLVENETARLPADNDLDAINNECTVPAGGVCIEGIDLLTGSGDGFCQGGEDGSSTPNKCVTVKVCYDHPMIIGIPFFSTADSIHMCSKTTMRLAHD
ncbi:MAG TPA: TadE/TadG family type IV pilus assembly protein [Dehalococcoidia bacterium]|nr:TadE/TadG family type IV pilus assembly protein [Dehalococcoidia bacterium]